MYRTITITIAAAPTQASAYGSEVVKKHSTASLQSTPDFAVRPEREAEVFDVPRPDAPPTQMQLTAAPRIEGDGQIWTASSAQGDIDALPALAAPGEGDAEGAATQRFVTASIDQSVSTLGYSAAHFDPGVSMQRKPEPDRTAVCASEQLLIRSLKLAAWQARGREFAAEQKWRAKRMPRRRPYLASGNSLAAAMRGSSGLEARA
jgi:hypothetical protein